MPPPISATNLLFKRKLKPSLLHLEKKILLDICLEGKGKGTVFEDSKSSQCYFLQTLYQKTQMVCYIVTFSSPAFSYNSHFLHPIMEKSLRPSGKYRPSEMLWESYHPHSLVTRTQRAG